MPMSQKGKKHCSLYGTDLWTLQVKSKRDKQFIVQSYKFTNFLGYYEFS